MKYLRDRVAVITGGANGIGLGLARMFVREGIKVVLADVNLQELDAAAAELTAMGGVVHTQRTDVSDVIDLERLADAAMTRFGAVHILCNNAGVGGFQRFENTTAQTWNWIVGVNLWGAINGTRIFLPILQKQDEAYILNTASMSGFTYAPDHHPYNVSKAGIVAFTEGLYFEFRRDKPHIGVSVLCPAHVNTRIGDDERNAPAGHQPRSITDPDLESFRQLVNSKLRAGKSPENVAEIVLCAMRERRLHIFTHPEWLEVIRQRTDDILAGRNLADAFGAVEA